MTTTDFKRRLSAILSADVQGYSRLMRDDEEATVRTITAYRTAMTHLIHQYRGRVVDSPGDNILAEFTSVVDAVNCGVEIQRELAERNAGLVENRKMRFRIGINLGDILEEGQRIYGDGVNIAARMEGLATAGEICISGTVYDAIQNKIGLEYDYLGEHEVKNIDQPVRAYRVLSHPGNAAHRVVKAKKAVGRTWRNLAVVATILILVAGAAAIWQFYYKSTPPTVEPASMDKMAFPLPDKPSIAVLPFDNMGGDPEQEVFSDGMTEDLITDLSRVSGLFVIARNSTFAYKGKKVTIRQVAEDLGVRYVLEGSVRKARDTVRITAQLIDATTGHHLWADRFDGSLNDIFALQDRVSRKIISALAVKLTTSEQSQLAIRETDKPAAYDAFIRGKAHLNRATPEDLKKAVSYFENATELDPNYSRAYAGVANAYLFAALNGMFKAFGGGFCDTVLKAGEPLEMAMKKPTSIAYQVSSFLNIMRRRHEQSIRDAEQSIILDPNDPGSYLAMGRALIWAGRLQEGRDFMKTAMRLDPLNPALYFVYIGMTRFLLGHYEEAATAFERVRAHNPALAGGTWVSTWLAATYVQLGRDDEVRAEVERYKSASLLPSISFRAYMSNPPFGDHDLFAPYVDASCKAGFAKGPCEYYKILKKQKLTGEEIKDLVFGRTVTGIFIYTGMQWERHCTKQGIAHYRDDRQNAYTGKCWIEEDMLCIQWQTHNLYGGFKHCGPVFRNPEGTPETKDEFLNAMECWLIPFSVME